MTTFIIIFTILLALAGIGLAVWSIASTRKEYYQEYIGRKRND